MKFVYVLTSTPKDLYYEQALMSVWSLRYHMPQAHIIVLVDNKTKDSFSEPNRSELQKLAEIISVDFEDTVSNVERSRLIKTAIPDYVSGDFLYIDCDTIIADDLSGIDEMDCNIGGILDGHCLLNDHIHKKYFIARDKKLGFHGTLAEGFNFNGGIVFYRDTEEGHALFKNWNEAWKYSAYEKHDFHDQSALNEANYRIGLKMKQIPGEWNCQPSHGGLAYLKDAKIIHYYSSEFNGKNYIPYYKLADKTLQNRIKETGKIPEDVIEMIKEPKFQFNSVHLINDDRIVNIMQSPLTFTLADIKAHLPALFNAMEATMSGIRAIGKKIKK